MTSFLDEKAMDHLIDSDVRNLRTAYEKFQAKSGGPKCPPAQQGGNWDLSVLDGTDEATVRVRGMVQDLMDWKAGKVSWSDLSPTLILEGEPGSGKTYLAHSIKKIIGSDHAVITGYADWQSAGGLGETLKAMKDVFKKARSAAPCFLFIDEIDSLSSRTAGDRNSNYWRSLINGFLEEMNVDTLEGVIVIGACNDASGIDPAILREGRFDEVIQMQPLGPEQVEKILREKVGTTFDTDDLHRTARNLVGITPAKIDGTIRKLKSRQRHQGKAFDLETLEDEILPPKDRREAIWRRVAIHECGHAIACQALGRGTVRKVMMRSDGSGFAVHEPHQTEGVIEDLDAQLIQIMAGRAAEKIATGTISSGAGGSRKSDLAKATRIAQAIELRLGMGSKHHAHIFEDSHDAVFANKGAVRISIRDRVSSAYKTACKLLTRNVDLLISMSEDLLEKRILNGADLEGWMYMVPKLDKEEVRKITARDIVMAACPNRLPSNSAVLEAGPSINGLASRSYIRSSR